MIQTPLTQEEQQMVHNGKIVAPTQSLRRRTGIFLPEAIRIVEKFASDCWFESKNYKAGT